MKTAACAACAAACTVPGRVEAGPSPVLSDPRFVREASYWKRLEGGRVECGLCPRSCKTSPGERGTCGVRENRGGTYHTLVWGRPCTINVDPIEKKPMFHFRPGTRTFSLATAGCNMDCRFCQNWEISRAKPEQLGAVFTGPREIVEQARTAGAASIAFTYSEPVVSTEYALAIAEAGREAGLPGITITNGYIRGKPHSDLLKVLGAVKIDFKGFTEEFYKKTCSGELKPVLESMERVAKAGVWLEIVHLTIPSLNDSEAEIKGLASWIRDHLGA
ncbi:MAG: AmmeMemoRadiSam system radical SAM enzyme, partial [Myxococcota bacterium]